MRALQPAPGRDHLPFIALDPSGSPAICLYFLTREKFNEVTKALVEATLKPCEMALKDAKMGKTEISEIVLVGGIRRQLVATSPEMPPGWRLPAMASSRVDP